VHGTVTRFDHPQQGYTLASVGALTPDRIYLANRGFKRSVLSLRFDTVISQCGLGHRPDLLPPPGPALSGRCTRIAHLPVEQHDFVAARRLAALLAVYRPKPVGSLVKPWVWRANVWPVRRGHALE
jgi:hypothetical protein